MAVQMIFCVETNKKSDTDGIYITETIRQWYVINNSVKISKVYMNTKSKYNSKDVEKEIVALKKAFTIGETKVFYCIDTDQYEKDPKHAKEFNDIGLFCTERDYELIWFCHDVEEVFWGEKVKDSEKVQKAAAFRRKRGIEEITPEKLICTECRTHSSNILNVLDQYLPRKKK